MKESGIKSSLLSLWFVLYLETHSVPPLTFSSSHGAKPSFAAALVRGGRKLGEERSYMTESSALTLSLQPLLPYISRPLFTSQWCNRNGCFVLLTIPPFLALFYLFLHSSLVSLTLLLPSLSSSSLPL